KQAKSEAGLADYQVRTWEGWHHHQALSLLATWFLTQETRRGKNPDTCADSPASARADRWPLEPSPRSPSPGPRSPHHQPPLKAQRGSKVLPLETPQTLAPTTF